LKIEGREKKKTRVVKKGFTSKDISTTASRECRTFLEDVESIEPVNNETSV